MGYCRLKSLLQNFDEKNFLQFTAISSINIHEMVPKILHDPKIEKDRKSESDYNFLDLSAYYGNEDAFNYFLTKVPSSIIFNSSNNFPLIFYALKGKNEQIIKTLTKKGKTAEVFFSLYHGLFYSLKLGDIQHLNKFFKKAKKLRPDDSAETVLYDTFQSPDHKPRSPLKLAIKSRNIQCVAFVLNISQKEIPSLIETKQGRKARKNALTPLHVAARYGCGDIAYLLITLEPKMQTRKGTNKYFYPFVDVLKYNIAPKKYEEYFKHGKKDKFINLTDSQGNGALHYAIKHGNINAVGILLLENKIDVNLKGEEGKRPLHFAAQSCSREILMKLLNHPAINLEEKDDYGNLAIHDAAESNWDEGFLIILQEMAKKRKRKREILQSDIDSIKYTEPSASFDEKKFKIGSQIFDSPFNNPIPHPINNISSSINSTNNSLISSSSNSSSSSSSTIISGIPVRNMLYTSADVYGHNTPNQNIITNNNNTSANNSTDISFPQNVFNSSAISSSDISYMQSSGNINPSNNNSSTEASSEISAQQSSNNSNVNNFNSSSLQQTNSGSISKADMFTNTAQNNEINSDIIPKPNLSNNMDYTISEEAKIDDEILQFTEDIIFIQNQMGLCCFHIAAIKNCVRIFDCLEMKYPMIAQKIYEYHSGLTGFTVLHYLAMCGHSKLLKKIIDKHPSIDIDIHGIDPIVSPLYQASKFNHEKCVKVLKIGGANIQKLTKRQRDIKTYVHSEFMGNILFGNTDDVKKINLDVSDMYANSISLQNPDSLSALSNIDDISDSPLSDTFNPNKTLH